MSRPCLPWTQRCATLALGVFLLAAAPAQAQDGTPLFFLTLPPDAAGVARGDARVADADGPLALAYNPAGLVGAGRAATLGHTRWADGATTYTGGGTIPVGRGTAALYVATASLGLQDDGGLGTDEPGEGGDGFQYLNLTAAYAHPISFGEDFALHLGGAAKVLGERVSAEYSRGLALDVGAQFAWRGDALSVGIAVQNVGQMSSVLGIEATPLPRTLRAGIAIRPLTIQDEDGEPFISATLSVDASRITPQDQNRLHLGLEVELFGFAALRTGLLRGEDLREFSLGAGLREGGVTLDYAVTPLPEGRGPAHFLTLGYRWL